MGDLLWLHSGGAFNKEPDNDLGNYPSQYEIPDGPLMNNLFDDILPVEADEGKTDYRCIYFWNPGTTNAVTDFKVGISQCEDCIASGMMSHGSKLQNDIQKIIIQCEQDGQAGGEPDEDGYVIFVTEFGGPFTVYWKGDWSQFAQDMQARINAIPWCEDVIVTLESEGVLLVEFTGGVGNRRVCLIRVVQNNLTKSTGGRFNTETYFSCDEYNGIGKSIVRTVQPISDSIPQSGVLYIYNPLNGLWEKYPYMMHTAFEFFLEGALAFNMVGFKGSCPPTGDINYPQNWQRAYPSPAYYGNGQNLPLPVPWGVVEAPGSDKQCEICITKEMAGSPINTIAEDIHVETESPSHVEFSQDEISVGNLRPNEGFYWWIKRDTPSMSPPCLEHFVSLNVEAVKVSWPIMGG